MQQQTSKIDSAPGVLLVFFGMIATGKSYLAAAWAEQHNVLYYNSDRVRKDLAGITPETGQREEVDQGIYTPEFSRRTYDALIGHAEDELLKDPQATIVLDGSYQSADERALLKSRFSGRTQILFVHCFCSEDVVKKRLAIRESDPDAVSDGTWKIYLSQKRRFQQITEEERLQVLGLDTDVPLKQLIENVDRKLMGN